MVTSDVPIKSPDEHQLVEDLKGLSSTAEFLVHLGNIQNASLTNCEAERYEEVADVFMESPVPVFVLPGEEDWNNCPDQDDGWYAWVDNFMKFDRNF